MKRTTAVLTTAAVAVAGLVGPAMFGAPSAATQVAELLRAVVRISRTAIALAAVVVGVVAVPGAAAQGAAEAASSLPDPIAGATVPVNRDGEGTMVGTVTLLTGDRVTVRRVGQRLLPELDRGRGAAGRRPTDRQGLYCHREVKRVVR